MTSPFDRRQALLTVVLLAGHTLVLAAADPADIRPWARSAHAGMLERILPPAIARSDLPEPSSEGARLLAAYCVQCHYLPSPYMHSGERWKSVVERMVWRMRGNGNMGALMKDLMAQVRAPTDSEVQALVRYLERHGQRELAASDPMLATRAGEMFALACTQCHVLPDPRRHTMREWTVVVNRMKRHMSWVNTVIGRSELRTEPELDTDEIVRFLQRHARDAKERE